MASEDCSLGSEAVDEGRNSARLVEGIDVRALSNEGTEFEVAQEGYPPGETVANHYKNLDAYKYSSIFETQDVPDDELGDESVSPFEKLAKTMKPLTECGSVLKQLMKAGVGASVAPDQVIRIHYNAYQEFQDEPYDSTYLRGSPMVIRLEEGQVIFGLEVAIRSMCLHEVSRFLVRPDCAYGERGCPPRIAPNATLLFQVEILSINNVGSMSKIMSMPVDERRELTMKQLVQAASEEREQGNELFHEQKYVLAMKHYSKAINLLENSQIKDEVAEKLQQHALLKLYLNAAACKVQLHRYPEAITYCNRALDIEPTECKALYRKGIAKMRLGDYDAARTLFFKAYSGKPHDPALANALKDLDEAEKKSKLVEKDVCRKMFPGLSASSSTTKTQNRKDIGKETTMFTDAYFKAVARLREFADDRQMTELKISREGYTADELASLASQATKLSLVVSQEGPSKSTLMKVTRKP